LGESKSKLANVAYAGDACYIHWQSGFVVNTKFNRLCIMFKIIAFFIIRPFARFYVRVGILLTRGKHLHDRIISMRREGKGTKTS